MVEAAELSANSDKEIEVMMHIGLDAFVSVSYSPASPIPDLHNNPSNHIRPTRFNMPFQQDSPSVLHLSHLGSRPYLNYDVTRWPTPPVHDQSIIGNIARHSPLHIPQDLWQRIRILPTALADRAQQAVRHRTKPHAVRRPSSTRDPHSHAHS